MTTRLGVDFGHEARDLTNAEFRTHVEALCWSNRRGLDLLVPKRDLRRFAYSPDAEAATAGLVAKDWWADRGDCWYVGLHHPEWQVERSVIEQRREAGALYSRRHRMHKAGDYSVWGEPAAACELCGCSGGRILWEHCHAHNHHRGWTCARCNAILREIDKRPDNVRAWEQAGERVWLYWLRCYRCARRKTASPFPRPGPPAVEAGHPETSKIIEGLGRVMAKENPETGEQRDLTDAELDARLASANDEVLAGLRRSAEVDAGMRALYRRLSEQDLPGDPEFDAEAGLRDLLARIRREHPEAS